MDRLAPIGAQTADGGTVLGYGTLHDPNRMERGPEVVVLVAYQMASGPLVRAVSAHLVEVA